jgi:hypothetical protein
LRLRFKFFGLSALLPIDGPPMGGPLSLSH